MIFVELLEQRVVMAATSAVEPSWLDPYIAFLSDRSLSTDVKEAEMCRECQLIFGYPRIKSCINIRLEVHTYYVSTRARPSSC